MGNPAAFSYSAPVRRDGVHQGHRPSFPLLHVVVAGHQQPAVASQFLYGTPTAVPIPDLTRTDLLVMIGANPVVSHGSFLTAPRIRDSMHDIVKRGGRVVVVDPRKTETAAQFEWLGIVPDSDAYFLLSLLQVLFAEDLVDRRIGGAQADGLDWLAGQCAAFPPEATALLTGIEPATVRELARDLAATPHAALYGRFGTSVGRNGTLDGLPDRRGQPGVGKAGPPRRQRVQHAGHPGQRWGKVMGAASRSAYRRKRSRIGGFGSVAAAEPATLMAKEILTPGKRQIKALFVSAGNPVLSVPNGDELAAAMCRLELSVALDLYRTETSALCDYILPVTTMYERDDFAVRLPDLPGDTRFARPPRRSSNRSGRPARNGTSSPI